MAAYRFYDPASVFWNILGTEGLRQGSVQFYEIGTTTPKNTWSDKNLTVLNANPLNLDASGRFPDDVFLDGDYTIKLTDGLSGTGSTVWTRDVISGSTAGTTIPALENGEFLTNDGATLQWSPILQVPDPTGQTGKVLTSTGAGATWSTLPSAAQPAIQVTATSVSLDDGGSAPNKMLLQMGTGSAPASGSETTSVSVVFPVAYNATPPFVGIQVVNIATASGVALVAHSITATSSTGFTVQFNIADRHFVDGSKIINAVPFTYLAAGIIP